MTGPVALSLSHTVALAVSRAQEYILLWLEWRTLRTIDAVARVMRPLAAADEPWLLALERDFDLALPALGPEPQPPEQTDAPMALRADDDGGDASHASPATEVARARLLCGARSARAQYRWLATLRWSLPPSPPQLPPSAPAVAEREPDREVPPPRQPAPHLHGTRSASGGAPALSRSSSASSSSSTASSRAPAAHGGLRFTGARRVAVRTQIGDVTLIAAEAPLSSTSSQPMH